MLILSHLGRVWRSSQPFLVSVFTLFHIYDTELTTFKRYGDVVLAW